jgi:hypothetical protein
VFTDEIRQVGGLVLDVLIDCAGYFDDAFETVIWEGWTSDDVGVTIEYTGNLVVYTQAGATLHLENAPELPWGQTPPLSRDEILTRTGMVLSPVVEYASALHRPGTPVDLELATAARTLCRVTEKLVRHL